VKRKKKAAAPITPVAFLTDHRPLTTAFQGHLYTPGRILGHGKILPKRRAFQGPDASAQELVGSVKGSIVRPCLEEKY
jgi:hypothetical protein